MQMAMGAKKVVLMLSYPSDEVGNALLTMDQVDAAGVNPYSDVLSLEKYRELFGENRHQFTGVDYVSYYGEIIEEAGGIDLQLLGLGHNGNIGFNEPSDTFDKVTHCVDLTESTINANARFFETIDDVPKQAYTMGIQNIMFAKKIVVVVSGKDKAEIVKKAFFGPITPQVPASALQFHPNVVLIGDEAALSLI